MSRPMIQQDRFVTWIEIETGVNDKIVISESGEPDATITIPSGIYYCYSDDDGLRPNSNEFVPLYTTIQNLLTAGVDTTWTIRSYDNSNSIVKGRSIEVESTILGWSFNTAATTFPLSYLSFGADAATSSTFGTKRGEYSYRGAWSPYSLVGERVDKRSYQMNQSRFSDTDTRRSYVLQVREGKHRMFEYSYVPPQNIFESRNADPNYQADSLFPDDDLNNSLDHLWSTFGSSSEEVGLRPLLVVHDDGDQDLEVWSHDWEVLIPRDQEQILNFQNLVSDLNIKGEFYRVSFDMWSIDADPNYTY